MRLFPMLLLGAAAVAIAERVPAAADGAVCVVYVIDFLPEYLPNISSVRREDAGDHDHMDRLECWFDDFEGLEIINADSKVLLEIESAVTRIYVAASERERGVVDMSSEKVHILPPSPIMMAKSRVSPSGTKTVLVVRVNGLDEQNTISEDEMYQDVFADKMNPAKGFKDCSGGKFQLQPYRGNNVNNGVYTVNLNQNVSGVRSHDVQAAVTDVLPRFSGVELRMYMLPFGVSFSGAAAYAYVNGYLSVYNGRFARHHMVLMHELGHNLNQLHSGKGGKPYGDKTCHMGNSLFTNDGPQACFNGAKSWHLGWYQNGHGVYGPGSGRVTYDLVSLDDYVGNRVQSGQKLILQLPGDDKTYYLMYNRAKGINSEVQGAPDTVTITNQDSARQQSWHLAALELGKLSQDQAARGLRRAVPVPKGVRALGSSVPPFACHSDDLGRLEVPAEPPRLQLPSVQGQPPQAPDVECREQPEGGAEAGPDA